MKNVDGSETSAEMQAAVDAAHKEMAERTKRIKEAEAKPKPMTRLELLEKVNKLNMQNQHCKYWTVVVMYNTVIWRKCCDCQAEMFELIEGQPK